MEGFTARGWTAGLFLLPSISLSEEYTSNFRGTPSNPESDFITRPSARLTLGYIGPSLTLLGTLEVAARIYAEHSDENGVEGLAGVSASYVASPQLRFGVNAAFRRAQDTRDVRETTGVIGVAVGRRDITAITVAPFLSYDFTQATRGEGVYTFTRTDEESGSPETQHELSLRLSRQLTAVDQGSLRYHLTRTDSDVEGTGTFHAVLLGYTRQLTPVTTVTLEAGPQFSEDKVDVEGRAALSHRLRYATVMLEYARGVEIVVGRVGSQRTDTVSGAVAFEPIRLLFVRLGGSVAWISDVEGSAPDTTIYTVGVTVDYPITTWLTANASYRYTLDENGDRITYHIAQVGVTLSYPIRPR